MRGDRADAFRPAVPVPRLREPPEEPIHQVADLVREGRLIAASGDENLAVGAGHVVPVVDARGREAVHLADMRLGEVAVRVGGHGVADVVHHARRVARGIAQSPSAL